MAMEPQTGNIKSMGWRYQLQILSIRSRRTRSKTSRFYIQAICLRYCNRAVKHVSCDSIIDAPFTMPGRHHATEAWSPKLTTSTAEW
jgi:hypothetical protein